jgi:hypothetical protein
VPRHALTPTATTRGRVWIRVGVRSRDSDWNRGRVRDRDRERDRYRYRDRDMDRYRYRDRDRDMDMDNLSGESHPAPVSTVLMYCIRPVPLVQKVITHSSKVCRKKIFIFFS